MDHAEHYLHIYSICLNKLVNRGPDLLWSLIATLIINLTSLIKEN